MPDKIQNQKVISQGGLNTLNNYLTLSAENPGAAVRLQNFESSLAGGYAKIKGYKKLDALNSLPGEGRVLGVWVFYNTTTMRDIYIAARKDVGTDTYKFYQYALGIGWSAFTPGFTQNYTSTSGLVQAKRIRAEMFNHGDGNQIIFVDGVNFACVYNGSTWFQLKSTNTGGVSPGGDQLIDAPSVVTSFKNHIFVSGDADHPAVISHCAPSDITRWTSAAGAGQLIFGFEVVQIKPFRDELYVFGKTNIKKIVIEGLDFVFKDVTNGLGCVARDSVVELSGDLLFLSNDGIRPVAGTDKINDVELGLLSGQIQEIIDSVYSQFDLTFLNAVVIRNKSQFRYFISDDITEDSNSYGLIGSVRRNSDLTNRWEFGELVGIHANCAWSGIVGTKEVVLHGGYDGVVYKQEEGNSFDGESIRTLYATPYIDLDDTQYRKTMHELNVFLKSEGSFELNISVHYDWGMNSAVNPANYAGTLNASITYDSGYTYGGPGSVYGGLDRTVFTQPIQGSGYSVQYVFSSQGDDASFTIHGFVHEFSVQGRQ